MPSFFTFYSLFFSTSPLSLSVFFFLQSTFGTQRVSADKMGSLQVGLAVVGNVGST